MVSRRKLVRTSDEDYPGVDGAIAAVGLSAKAAKELRKDIHLVHAALWTDRVIFSLDCAARDGFRNLSPHVGRIKRLKWLDPGNEYEQVQAWLKGGK